MAMRLWVGTSGFSYDEWRGAFYPEELGKGAMLEHYATKLPAVELNNTFYRMPTQKAVQAWAAAVPQGFRFAIKASQSITWMRKLRDCEAPLTKLFTATAELGDKLGCIFYQLPKYVPKDVPLLQAFLAQQRPGIRIAFEFAHASWLDPDALEVLQAHAAAVVRSDRDEDERPELLPTATWAYLRLRRTAYGDDDLRRWLDELRARDLDTAFVFFKHEDACAGPALATRLLELAEVG